MAGAGESWCANVRLRTLVGSVCAQQSAKSPQNDAAVRACRRGSHVFEIDLRRFGTVERNAGSTGRLPEPRYPGRCEVPQVLPRLVSLDDERHLREGPDPRNLASQDVDKL